MNVFTLYTMYMKEKYIFTNKCSYSCEESLFSMFVRFQFPDIITQNTNKPIARRDHSNQARINTLKTA